MKKAPVRARGHADASLKCCRKVCLIGETAGGGNVGETPLSVLQHSLRPAKAPHHDISMRAHAHCLLESPREMKNAHRCDARQGCQRKTLIDIGFNEVDHVG